MRSDDSNVFEAAANGAAVASKTVAAVISCYIAFLSMLALINATLSWLGGRVGFPELSFEVRYNPLVLCCLGYLSSLSYTVYWWIGDHGPLCHRSPLVRTMRYRHMGQLDTLPAIP